VSAYHSFHPPIGNHKPILLHTILNDDKQLKITEVSKLQEMETKMNVVLAVHVAGNSGDVANWHNYKTQDVPKSVTGVEVLSVDKFTSTLLLVQIPVRAYCMLFERQAYQFIPFTSERVYPIPHHDPRHHGL